MIKVQGRTKFEVEMDNAFPSSFQRPQLSWRNERADCNDDDEPLVDPADPLGMNHGSKSLDLEKDGEPHRE